jgi:flagella basal body P-ring formation protein FlgA
MTRLALLTIALLMAFPAFADTGLRVVVPAHDIARGDTIQESDLTYQTIADANVMSGTVTSMTMLVGMEARRVLRAGESVRGDDVRHPILVTKGSTVTMTFEAPGITLIATGRAMGEGGQGQTVTVLNPASYRQISAVVTGPGTVRAESSLQQLANAKP